jgi:hypothetical protein
MGGEKKVENGAGVSRAAAFEQQRTEWMGTAGRGYNKPTGKRLPAALAALTVAATALLMMPLTVDEALAQRLI